ncbi:ethanolamine utilization protein EutA [Halogranum amylolyticum]|uniref:Ethanolamine utilization protein EutA n=1 Tax=Halogranum amylolyticum TaxID=660520 RepID=A0A1H8WM54_9EURY|nr:ethanolamine ammonia-lyase reactivating factor EutA [Halogranum amylolyticum]SEP28760.1 ethanolamine utilization protein EutA [Halogranum amylolyticum]
MAAETPTLTSVGIDIGTTTTQLIISELTLSTTGLGAVTVEIEDTDIVYRGTIYETPLLDHQTLDVDAIADLVTTEFETAGYTPENIDSGAVIVTGESSYKTNAEELVTRIAADAGEFVVATAGPELESVLAGTGSGAATWARQREATILNVDIGGGTTNMCLFAGDSVVETRCLDVGGRLLRFDPSGALTHISLPAAQLLEEAGLSLEIGSRPADEELRELAALMADAVFETIDGTGCSSITKALTIGESEYASRSIDGICFSGGVGQLIVSDTDNDLFAYHDFGNFLAAAIRDRLDSSPVAYRSPNETIRATVIGAGTQTTSFSGTTVSLDEDALPLRNLPVVEASLTATDCTSLAAEVCRCLEHALALHETQQLAGLVLALPDVGSLSYDRMQTLAQALTQGYADAGYTRRQLPVVIVLRQNCAKALAQCLRASSTELSPLVVIDEIAVSDGDYLDVGEPMLSSQAVPVVVKSLIFGSPSAAD